MTIGGGELNIWFRSAGLAGILGALVSTVIGSSSTFVVAGVLVDAGVYVGPGVELGQGVLVGLGAVHVHPTASSVMQSNVSACWCVTDVYPLPLGMPRSGLTLDYNTFWMGGKNV